MTASLAARDVDVVAVYAVPMTERFRRITVREGVLLRGPRTAPVPDPDLLERWRLRDASRVAWWHDRLARVAALLPGA